MSNYSIKQLSQISGVKPHTIRIWEQRYGLLHPNRSQSNIRSYDDEQLKKMLNVCQLLNLGFKISHVSALSPSQINEEIEKIIYKTTYSDVVAETIIAQILIAAATFDEILFEKTFNQSVANIGLEKTYVTIVCPALVRIGLMWIKDDFFPAQEHFFCNLIKKKLFSAIDSLPLNEKSNEIWVLFLNANEEHEIGLIFVNYILRKYNKRVIYLGRNVPVDNLKNVIEQSKALNVYTFFIKKYSSQELKSVMDSLELNLKNIHICFSGNAEICNQIKQSKRMTYVQDIETLIDIANK